MVQNSIGSLVLNAGRFPVKLEVTAKSFHVIVSVVRDSSVWSTLETELHSIRHKVTREYFSENQFSNVTSSLESF